jgi:hypothetical protein
MSDWMCIRVTLSSGGGSVPAHPPGRVLLVHSDHTFADLAEAIDVAFGRWDLTPTHTFEVEGRRLLSSEAAADPSAGPEVEDSDEVTVGEAGLRLGAWFRYEFDPGERWEHDCSVEDVDVDPFQLHGEEPDQPVPVFGWGALPDQYGRLRADDDDVADDDWVRPESASWEVVYAALAGIERPLPADELARAAAALRTQAGSSEWPFEVLLAAGGLDGGELPDDDETLWVQLAAGVVSPREPLPLEPEEEAGWAALEPADWAGAVIELVRSGVGQAGDADTLLELIARCPEVEVGDWTAEDEDILADGLDTVAQLWAALGVLDDEQRLTALGRWGLPESLRLAWG